MMGFVCKGSLGGEGSSLKALFKTSREEALQGICISVSCNEEK